MTSHALQTVPLEDGNLSEMLDALAVEITDVVHDCRSLEDLIGDVLSGKTQGQSMQRLQSLDFIIQRLEGVMTVLETLSGHAPAASIPLEQVLRGVRLATMAQRLSGGAPASTTPPIASGDAEFW